VTRKIGVGIGIRIGVGIGVGIGTAHAYTHVVQPGETLAHIAQRTYGDTKYETVLVGANALDVQGGSAIVAGMRIEIPAPGHHRVEEHETWSELALAWLGDTKRADVLARENGAVSWVPPVAGQEIVIPTVIAHIAGDGESTTTLARRYYGNPNRSWELDQYNGKKPVLLRRGEVVLVPLPSLALTEQGKAEARRAALGAVTEGAGAAHEAQKHAEAEIPVLLAHVHGGRYVDAVTIGNRLLGTGELTRPQLATVHRALLEAYVALDATGAASGACTAWRASTADVKLDAKSTSPKIRAACGVK
jgi:LysM repeat protein